MSKFSRPRSWAQHRLADRFAAGGGEYTVDLVARRGTGITGYRMTVVFLPREEGSTVETELPNAASTAEVHTTVRELAENSEQLGALFQAGHPA